MAEPSCSRPPVPSDRTSPRDPPACTDHDHPRERLSLGLGQEVQDLASYCRIFDLEFFTLGCRFFFWAALDMVIASKLRERLLPLALRSTAPPAGASWSVHPAGATIIHRRVGILAGYILRRSVHDALPASAKVIGS